MTALSESPLLANISSDDIEMFVACGDTPVLNFPKDPYHTKAVERCVKLVTEAVSSACKAK